MMLKISIAEKISTSQNLSILFLASLFISTNVFSAAGDSINATATINYTIGGVPAVSSASTAFTEDRRINFVVTESNGGLAIPVISNMTNAVMQFTITNTGNDTHDFLVTAVDTLPNPFGSPADSFDVLPVTIQTFVESGATPGYQVVEDTAMFVDELAPNISRVVYVLADMPPALAANAVAAIALIAQVAEGGTSGAEGVFINADDNGRISPAGDFSNTNTNMPDGVSNTIADSTSMETVFNDLAGLNPEDISTNNNQDVAGNGQHSDAGAYQVTSPVIITKSVTVLDTLGGNDPHQGATLRYQLEVTAVGNTPVDDLVITDDVPANTSYVTGSITLEKSTVPGAVVQTDLNDSPGTDFTQAIGSPVTSIEVDLSEGINNVSVGPGVTYTIIFEVTIN